MKKRLVAGLLLMAMLLSLLPVTAFAEDDLVPVEAPEIDAAEVVDAAVDVDAVEITPEAEATVDEIPAEEIPAEEIIAEDETEEAETYLASASSLSNPRIVSDSSMTAGQKVTYDCIWFGSYPQAEVVSSKSMMTTAIGVLYLNDNDYIVDAALYSQLQSATGWSNNEITLGGNKYRRMCKADATYATTGDDYYYNWSDTTTYHYFKYQPIKWRVLQVNGSTALLLADECLDDIQWNSWVSYGNTWSTSQMRSWLNSYGASSNTAGTDYSSTGFLGSAFTAIEKAAIINGTVQNNVTGNYTDGSGTDTTDRIFLLSHAESLNAAYGFSTDYDTRDEARRAQASTYARARGTLWGTNSLYFGNSFWWLRSVGSTSSRACNVSSSGDGYNDFGVSDFIYGARPALKINLTSSGWSYAGTVCTDGTVAEQGGSTGTDWDLLTPDELQEEYIREHAEYYYTGDYETDIVSMSDTMGLGYLLEDADGDVSDALYKGLSIAVEDISFMSSLLNPSSYFEIEIGSEQAIKLKVPDFTIKDLGSSEYSVVLYQLMASDSVYSGIQETSNMLFQKNLCSFASNITSNFEDLAKDAQTKNNDEAKNALRTASYTLQTADPGSEEFMTAYSDFSELSKKYLGQKKTKNYLESLSDLTGDAYTVLGTTLSTIEDINVAFEYAVWAQTYVDTREEFFTILRDIQTVAKNRANWNFKLNRYEEMKPYSTSSMLNGLSNAIDSFISTMDQYAADPSEAALNAITTSVANSSTDLVIGFLKDGVIAMMGFPVLAEFNAAMAIPGAVKIGLDLLTNVDDEYKLALTVESLEIISSLLLSVSRYYGNGTAYSYYAEPVGTDPITGNTRYSSPVNIAIDQSNQLYRDGLIKLEPGESTTPTTTLQKAVLFDQAVRMYKNALLLACEYGIKYENSKLTAAAKKANSAPSRALYAIGVTTPWQEKASRYSTAIVTLSVEKLRLNDIHCHDDGLNYNSSSGLVEYTGNRRIVSVACPVDVTVLAPDGRQIASLGGGNATVADGYSPYFQTLPLDEEGTDYVKIISVPSDENYKININGTGNGTMTVFVGEINDTEISEETYANFPVTPESTGEVTSGNETNALGTLVLDDVVYDTSLHNPEVVSDSSMKSGQKVTYDCVWFGSYPQAVVVSSKEMMTTAIGEDYLDDNDYIVDANLYSQLQSATGWDSNNEITLGGNKYRRMLSSDATYARSGVSCYYNWSDSTTYHYFKYQPIKWRVLQVNGSTALLLADECLDAVVWNSDSDYGNEWATSEIRSWLNSYGASSNTAGTNYSATGFLSNAFNSTQKAAIINGTVQNNVTGNFTDDSGTATTDRIFLLSRAESLNAAYGFDTSYSTYDEARRAQASTYARARGTWWNTNSSYLGNSWWWLRSAGSSSSYACSVFSNGSSDIDYYVGSSYDGARPALKINLTSSGWSYAGTVCTDGTVAEKQFECTVHDYYDVLTKEPTCTEAGERTLVCGNCSYTYTEEVAKTGHSYGAWTTTKAASCTAAGSKKRTCTTCGKTETKSIAVLGHNWATGYSVDKAATCTAAGSKSIHCSICSATKDSVTIAATGHSYGAWTTTKAATCTAAGSKKHTCATCGGVETQTIAALGHNWATGYTVDTAATCTAAGSKSIHCGRCSATKDSVTIAATGHSYTNVVTKPTTTSRGYTTHTCSKCKYSYVDSYTDMLKTGWQQVSGKWYYYNASGVMVKSQWIKSGTKWYYVGTDGVMATSKWISSGGKWYYVGSDGVMATSKWISSGGKWYYVGTDGVMATSKWISSGGKWYYVGSDGVMYTSKWLKSGSSWYYLKSSGVMAVSESIKIGSKTYKFNASGVCTNP